MTRAYKFLTDDCRSGRGTEGPWSVGEKRAVAGQIVCCRHGYHACADALDALVWAPGSVLMVAEVGGDHDSDDGIKTAWRECEAVAIRDVARELRLWTCDCAERALTRERKAGREPNARSWEAVRVARAFADGQATREEMAAAAAYAAHTLAADYAYAARAAARVAAWNAEVAWQRERLQAIIDASFSGRTAEVTA